MYNQSIKMKMTLSVFDETKAGISKNNFKELLMSNGLYLIKDESNKLFFSTILNELDLFSDKSTDLNSIKQIKYGKLSNEEIFGILDVEYLDGTNNEPFVVQSNATINDKLLVTFPV